MQSFAEGEQRVLTLEMMACHEMKARLLNSGFGQESLGSPRRMEMLVVLSNGMEGMQIQGLRWY